MEEHRRPQHEEKQQRRTGKDSVQARREREREKDKTSFQTRGSLDGTQIFCISNSSAVVLTAVSPVGKTTEPIRAFVGGIKNGEISFQHQSQKNGKMPTCG